MKTTVRKQIAVSREERRALMKLFNLGERTVFYALSPNGQDTPLRRKVRRAAIERGGTVMVTLPEMETFHDADGVIRQHLPNGAQIELSKKDGWCEVWLNGELQAHFDNVRVRNIDGIQKYAASLRPSLNLQMEDRQ